jgi:hypothetical protein
MADANAYFAANPDVAASFSQNSYGLTPDQFATAHYNLYGASEQRAAPTVTAEVPASVAPATPNLPPPPTWMDAYNKWNAEQNLPERAAKGYTTPDMWAWNTDAQHAYVKDLLDKQYLENVRQYNAIYGTNIQPDTSVLGANAQPNQTYYTPDEGGGLFGGGGFLGTGIKWSSIRDPLEAAAVVAGNYILPGSSLLTGQLVSQGAKETLSSDLGKVANIAAGVTGGLQGNLDNYGKLIPGSSGLESVTAEQLAAANATDDPIAALNAIKGWTTADMAYLATVGGVTPEILAAANANNAYLAGGAESAGLLTPASSGVAGTAAASGLSAAQAANLARLGLTATGLLAGTKAISGLTSGGAGGISLPTQNRAGVSSGSAQYSPEYYAAIQAKYNQMMPQQPRDVTTELKNWYETKYAPSVNTPKVA